MPPGASGDERTPARSATPGAPSPEARSRPPEEPVAPRIRRLGPGDAAAYRALMLEAYAADPEAFTATPAERENLPLEWWAERLAEGDDPDSLVVGAFLGGRLAGAAGLRFERRPRTRHKATLFGLCVRGGARRRGLARILTEEVLQQARSAPGILAVQLTVSETNAPARALYEACGFRVFGTEPLAIRVDEGFVAKVHMWRPVERGGVRPPPERPEEPRDVTIRPAMDHLSDALLRAVEAWDERGWPRPDVVVFSGSGLSTRLGDPILSSSWSEVLPFPVRGIAGHSLEIELIRPTEGRVAISSRGRLHYYQGYTPAQVVFPVRLARLLGARVLLMTNSSGGLRRELVAGDLVLLKDHLNLMGMNPLHGVFPEAWGPQFPDMGTAYDPGLRRLIRTRATQLGLELREGVYAGMAGPSYETPAEVRMLAGLGADVVGMSTVPEVIAGHHMGLRCGCVSVVSNPGAGLSDEVLDHADVLERGRDAAQRAGKLLAAVLADPDLEPA